MADSRPNILILCMDQWQTHMELPEDLELPALRRLEAQGISFNHQYCTVPICTPSRATMWTGLHARKTGLWDNTNFAWIGELSDEIPTIGTMLREQGYYTAFKGKWHISEVPRGEGALERYGFADYQHFGEMYGAPLQGEMLDGAAAFETVDWLETRPGELEQPWLLVSSLINPHDIMFYQSDPVEVPHPNGAMAGLQTVAQNLGWFAKRWNVELPDNFDDDLALQPMGVRSYKTFVEQNYGRIPEGREDLWLKRRNYLINAMRLVDAQFTQILEAMDRQGLWENTIVIYTSDHGEMNGAHGLSQKGGIAFEEATVVNLTVVLPEGPRGVRTEAVGSHLDLAPTLLEFAGLSEAEIAQQYPHLKGRSLKAVMAGEEVHGPRGSEDAPGDGALICWDGLHALDPEWGLTGVLQSLTDMGEGLSAEGSDPEALMRAAGAQYGAPDFGRRTFYRAVVDGRYKLVRWFSPQEYGNPETLDALYEQSDVALYDLWDDPGELENLAHPDHPRFAPAVVEAMLKKLHALVLHEIGEDTVPFDFELFGTREVKYLKGTGEEARPGDAYGYGGEQRG